MRCEQAIRNLEFVYRKEQRKRFVAGALGPVWAAKYPELFDERDLQIHSNQPARHFYEWLSAVLIFESTGYRSLVEKYWSHKHPRKWQIYSAVAPEEIVELDEDYGWPDLFCYSKDHSDYFFCEVKGHPDSLKKAQHRLLPKLYAITKKPVLVLTLRTA